MTKLDAVILFTTKMADAYYDSLKDYKNHPCESTEMNLRGCIDGLASALRTMDHMTTEEWYTEV